MNVQPQPANKLLERLMKAVRPEFRADIFLPPVDSPVFWQGACRVPSCPTMISFAALGLCNAHYHRRRKARGIDFEAWLADEDTRTRERLTVPACAIVGCERALKGHSLCHRHLDLWARSGQPDVDTWLAATRYRPPRHNGRERACAVPRCERWTDGPSMALCRIHYESWRLRGRPTLEEWLTDVAWGTNPRIRLDALQPQARLEFQFGLQCRVDDGRKLTPHRTLTGAVRMLASSGVTSMLDWGEDQWRDFLWQGRVASFNQMARTFLLDTRFALTLLRAGDDPWADQYPRKVWDLHVIGIHTTIRRIRFDDIPQPELQDLVKRWARWRISRGIEASSVGQSVRSCAALARYLARTKTRWPEGVLRSRLEKWIAASASDMSLSTRKTAITNVRVFLADVHRNRWEPRLGPDALLYSDDQPFPKKKMPRWISEHLMAQIEDPANLALLRHTQDRVLVQILISCGLRIGCASTLNLDCVVRDGTGNPYLAWLNRKMGDRPSFFPLSESLATAIEDQRQRVLDHYPQGCRWLFPAISQNLDGSRSVNGSAFRGRLDRWCQKIRLTDERGQPARVTSHQFRHTVATRLINADVPQHVVQELLDHMSPEMTALYARLHNSTIREHWLRATKVNADGNSVTLASDHPLTDAAWMRLSLVRAKVTLPNGYCGAPVQTDCEYANPCLDCRFFITTHDFLHQHRRQRDETQQAIAEAKQSSLVRLVEKNTRTLQKLDRIIEVLETAGPDEALAGGTVTSTNAAS